MIPTHQLTQILQDHTLVGSISSPGGVMQFLLYQAPDGTGQDQVIVNGVGTLRPVRKWSVAAPGRFCLERGPTAAINTAPDLDPAAPGYEITCLDLVQYTTGLLVLHYRVDGADLYIPVQSLAGNQISPQ